LLLKCMARVQIIQPYPATGRRRSESKEPLRVYLVEDNVDIVGLLTTACEEIDNVKVVGWSASADDAIERIASSEPDVVLIDNQLRSGSGIDVIRAIRLMGADPAPLLLAMSNALTGTVREASLAAGADAYFDKTIDYGRLLTRIAALAR
jgi:two-component system response regulator DevR